MTRTHDDSDAFSEEVLREQTIFQYAKEAEMKEMLGNMANAQIEFYKAVRYFLEVDWQPVLTRRPRRWMNGIELSQFFKGFGWTFN